jgi:hypothetical protein
VSIGLAAGAGDAGRMLARADAALYDAKRGGRNRVLGSPGEQSAEPEPRPARLRTAIERPVLEAFADLVRSELRYASAVVDLRRGDDTFETVVVLGDDESRRGHVSTWESREPLLAPRHEQGGALLLPLRDQRAELLGVLTLGEPLTGRRPTDEELGELMAVADQAGLVLSLGS